MKRWLNEKLTRHSLWGHLPRRTAPQPAGPPLLALSFDLDYQRDTDVLDSLVALLAEHDAPATMFSIGKLVTADPDPYARAAAAGHELANHTWSHPDNPVLNPDREFWDLSVAEMTAEIGRCQDILHEVSGTRPCGFRSPHFKDAFRMMDAVSSFPELTYVSTALASRCPCPTPYFPLAQPRYADLTLHHPATGQAPGWSQLMIPLTPCPGLRWSPFCSYSSIRRPTDRERGAGLHTVEEWEALWKKMLRRATPRGFASVYFDPLDVMRDDETQAAFRSMLAHAKSSGWEIVTLQSLEQRWRPVAVGNAAG